jgi:hypothetical protein
MSMRSTCWYLGRNGFFIRKYGGAERPRLEDRGDLGSVLAPHGVHWQCFGGKGRTTDTAQAVSSSTFFHFVLGMKEAKSALSYTLGRVRG